MSVAELKEMSNRYGHNSKYVLASGGNTSFKDENYLYVKESGVSLADIDVSGFVKLERSALKDILQKAYPENENEREAAVLVELLAAKCAGQEGKCTSVETLLHDILPFSYVLHIHPSLVNGMTCGKDGKAIFTKLFSSNGLWINFTETSYVLATVVKAEVTSYQAKNGKLPIYVFLENHGVFIGGNDVGAIDQAVDEMNAVLNSNLKRTPDFSSCEFDTDLAVSMAPAVRILTSGDRLGIAVFVSNKEALQFVQDKASFEKAMLTFTPDHMAYCYDKGLFITLDEAEDKYTILAECIANYVQENSKAPKIIGIKGLGYFACGATKKEADIAAAIFLDAIKIAVYAESFGGGKGLSDSLVYAISSRGAEQCKKNVNFTGNASKRLDGKIAIITGSAQGFGKGIAEEMANEGAYIGVADLNENGANENAESINMNLGKGSAIGIKVNVGEELDVKEMIDKMVLNYGGLDVFVSNAGILKSGSLEEMDLVWFERMTKINYTAFFICTKYASRIMKIQNRVAPDAYMDIIQINSKSGLAGSNKNFAYAGGKFGGIGLTQSFALELVEFNIKVNAICPGNFFEGPLWNDPEKGLFVQYLNSGKVPGAKTIEDVKKFYEKKVPMGRGTLVKDVARAINYVVEQEYETGQAIPVTGGQEMLK